MNERQQRIGVVAFFALLFIIEWFLYFRHAGHFFQGDSVFLLHNRASSVSEYLREFVALNPSGWYRPLANELVQSILYPLAGLHPVPYRIPVYALFVAITIVLYKLAVQLTGRRLASILAVFFFAIHSVNAYTTFDIGFLPELLYGFFYVSAAVAFLHYVRSGEKGAYRLSLGFLIAGLFSKEAALTMPLTLLVIALAFPPPSPSFRQRLSFAVRSTLPHIAIVAAFFAFLIGYLNVMGMSPKTFTTIFDQSLKPSPGDYVAVLNDGVLKNADLAATWAFNIPRGYWGQWQRLDSNTLGYLKFVRALVLALMAASLLTSRRTVVLFGFAWFLITILPALPLVSHFIPYYVFLPVMGLSLAVGTVFAWVYDVLSRLHPAVAAAAVVVILGGVLYATSQSISGEIQNNALLGAPAELASNTLNDLKGFYPSLPADAALYFRDETNQLAWPHDRGGLIKMAYENDNVSVLYASQGESLRFGMGKVLVFGVQNGRLTDQSAEFRSHPERFLKFVKSDHPMELSAKEVYAGRDKYTLTIKGLSDSAVRIAYTVNDGPLATFDAGLDRQGKVTFDVSADTPRGVYKFVAFNISGSTDWFDAGQTLMVRDSGRLK